VDAGSDLGCPWRLTKREIGITFLTDRLVDRPERVLCDAEVISWSTASETTWVLELVGRLMDDYDSPCKRRPGVPMLSHTCSPLARRPGGSGGEFLTRADPSWAGAGGAARLSAGEENPHPLKSLDGTAVVKVACTVVQLSMGSVSIRVCPPDVVGSAVANVDIADRRVAPLWESDRAL
jgi:hypothetical protein